MGLQAGFRLAEPTARREGRLHSALSKNKIEIKEKKIKTLKNNKMILLIICTSTTGGAISALDKNKIDYRQIEQALEFLLTILPISQTYKC